MSEILISAVADQPEDALDAIRGTLDDILSIGYQPGFPDSATWEHTSRSGVPVRVSLTATPKED